MGWRIGQLHECAHTFADFNLHVDHAYIQTQYVLFLIAGTYICISTCVMCDAM